MAYLEGSRTHPNVPRGIFQDYNVADIVSETKSFREDEELDKPF
ncbi:MAG: aminoglycoside 6-adenylyltransferase [Oscillospiraceae bacterium]|nr:aminoglycoside 6-adenylyltransferase [Oscillospiraceae bacterium]